MRPHVEGVIDGTEQGESMAGTGSGEVVGVDRPGHDAGQALVVGELRLLADGSLIVVADPLDSFGHVGGLEDVNVINSYTSAFLYRHFLHNPYLKLNLKYEKRLSSSATAS